MPNLIFLHGFASSSQGTKAQFLRQKCQTIAGVDFHAIDFNPTPRDLEYMTVTGMINRLRQYILDHQLKEVRRVGSPLGAWVTLNYAAQYPNLVQLIEVASNHRLNDQLDFIWRQIVTFSL